MDLEFGLKFSKPIVNDDDLISTDLHISKDRGGLLFMSTETDSMFILTAHLRGYKRENIRMSISPDGTQLKIEGQYPIQETVLVGGEVLRNIKTFEFKKAFRIPDGVVLNDVNATFDEESVLKITMPKTVHGIRGMMIQEVIEEDRDYEKNEKMVDTTNVDKPNSPIENRDGVNNKMGLKEIEETRSAQENTSIEQKDEKMKGESQEEDREGHPQSADNRKSGKDSVLCNSSLIVGSALFASLIAIVIHFIKTKTQPKKRDD
ncbi:uncharacterized protein LOC124910696 [Impatiens glandulifera]|uniref:uncharacterized protein LOC124910696 n=1 Tax=Impatiens glandulifera TaxID=253017 RepID=UPI001FB05CD5|nr:uncharacterized protein LOC124910696 [Impatiens glandulifera]